MVARDAANDEQLLLVVSYSVLQYSHIPKQHRFQSKAR